MPAVAGPSASELAAQQAAARTRFLANLLERSTHVARVQVQSAVTLTEIVVMDSRGVPEAIQIRYATAAVVNPIRGEFPPSIDIRHMPSSCGASLEGDAIVFLAQQPGYFQRTYALDVVDGNVNFEGEVLSVAQFLERL